MKSKLTIYPNGFQIRKHNTRITFVEEEDKYSLTFQRYVGGKIVTARVFNTRGVAETLIHLKKDTFEEIIGCYIEYKINKDEKT